MHYLTATSTAFRNTEEQQIFAAFFFIGSTLSLLYQQLNYFISRFILICDLQDIPHGLSQGAHKKCN